MVLNKTTKWGLALAGLGALGSALAVGLGVAAEARGARREEAPRKSMGGMGAAKKVVGKCPHCGGAHVGQHHPGDGHNH